MVGLALCACVWDFEKGCEWEWIDSTRIDFDCLIEWKERGGFFSLRTLKSCARGRGSWRGGYMLASRPLWLGWVGLGCVRRVMGTVSGWAKIGGAVNRRQEENKEAINRTE